jgi:hypothetical protein
MCWRFLRDFWTGFLFACRVSSGDGDRAVDVPGPEGVKGIGVGGGKGDGPGAVDNVVV